MIDIDFVIPWVNDSDPLWQAAYSSYSDQEDKRYNKSGERFRDWGLLRFFFRSVEKYAPWVRTVHFITCGHYPEWLDINHPKLNFVKHADYIPQEYLPTFCANTIELNLHRIKELSEHFVYFNDDMFLSAPTLPSDFFMNGLPRDLGLRNYIGLYEQGHVELNNVNLINKNLEFHDSYKKNIWKWYNYRYGLQAARNIFFIRYKDFTGAKITHLPAPFLKSSFFEVWDACGDALHETSLRKFRNIADVNQWLIKEWQLVNGNFFPQNMRYGRYMLANEVDTISRVLTKQRYKTICVNDCDWKDISRLKNELQAVFSTAFPEKSSFEL